MNTNSFLLLLIPLMPLIGFIINGFFNKKLSKGLVGIVACGSILISFLLSICLFAQLITGTQESFSANFFTWIHAGDLNISFSFLVDHLSSVMLLVITGVGFLIHVYSVGYMSHDEDHPRYFAYLNLFVFFMLLLVMGSNYVVMFTGWEGVGLCSYLLIGFWFKNTAYNNAAKKAFVMNRIGDLGFLLGMFLMFQKFGSLDFTNVFSGAKSVTTGDYTVTTICILLFIGAMGKSAQIPLYTWLPDAMAGPTPVSALIHAATMVTAGIYMVARTNILYTLSPIASQMVAIVGVATAFFAATIGLKQNDIKKVLAYSTVSQLGFMFAALGVGAYSTGMFHVVTHAFFKALLFLCAGSVIHAMGGEQDIRRMGGLKKKLPITHLTFLIGTLAITGVPLFAGFFSKDEILAKVYASGNMVMFFMLCLTTVITAIYMFRLYWITFYGEFRGSHHQQEHLHESPSSMTITLMVLAVLSTVGGFLGMPAIFNAPHFLNRFLEPSMYLSGTTELETSHTFEYVLIASACVALILVILATYNYYVKQSILPEEDAQLKALTKVVSNKYYIDELYENFITKPLQFTSQSVYKYIEKMVIDGAVNGMGWLTNNVSATLRLTQSGKVGLYVFSMTIGIILILAIKFLI